MKSRPIDIIVGGGIGLVLSALLWGLPIFWFVLKPAPESPYGSAADEVVHVVDPTKLAIDVTTPTECLPGEILEFTVEGNATLLKWAVVPASKSFKTYEGGRRAVFATPVGGTFTFVLAASDPDELALSSHTVVVGGHIPEPPVPPIVPPTPDPVVPGGPLTAYIVYESAMVNPDVARTLTNLRDGPQAKYLADKKHTLVILDDDSVDANNKPLPFLQKHAPFDPKGELLILDKERLLERAKLPATAELVVEALRKAGG